jgi:hypothetical protein
MPYADATIHDFADDVLLVLTAGGTLRLRDDTVTVCDITLETVAFDRSGLVLTARGEDGANPIGSGNPLIGSSAAGGTIDNYQVLTSGAAVIWSRPDTTGLTLDTLVIAGSGREVRLTGWTHTISG